MSLGAPVRFALRAVIGAGLFFATLEIAARAALAWPPAHYALNTGGPAARKLIAVDMARRMGRDSRIHIDGVDPDPELGWILAANLKDAVGHLTTGPDRHRVTHPADRSFTPDAPAVVLLGDSFTLGLEVADAQTWAWKLQEGTGARVVNGGVHGYGLDQAVLHFERDLAALRPSVVVLGLDEPLLMRAQLEWDAWAKPWFTLEGGALVPHGVPVPSPQQVMDAAPRSMAVAMWPVVIEHYLYPPAAGFPEPLASALIDRLNDAVRAAGGRLVLLRMPVTTNTPRDGYGRVPAWFTTWCTKEGVACVDLGPSVEAAVAAGDPLVSGVHWSPEVSARVGAQLTAELLDAGLIPPRSAEP